MKIYQILFVAFSLLIWNRTDGQSERFSLLQIHLDVLAPVGTYKDFTRNSYVGAILGWLTTTRYPSLYAGAIFSYGLYDTYDAFFTDFTVGGFSTEYRETLYNSHLSIALQGRYMPGWFTKFQPYAEFQTGFRRLGTYFVLTDIIADVHAGTTNYHSAWAVQYAASVGVLLPINRFTMLDFGVSYLETQAISHYLRQKDWRSLSPVYSTDIFEKRRTGVKMAGIRIGVSFLL